MHSKTFKLCFLTASRLQFGIAKLHIRSSYRNDQSNDPNVWLLAFAHWPNQKNNYEIRDVHVIDSLGLTSNYEDKQKISIVVCILEQL